MDLKEILAEFSKNYELLKTSGNLEPTAMVLSTVSADGRPSGRVVLLKEFSERGFVFFTNYESRKGQQMAENPFVALTLVWHELKKQVRIEGRAEKLSAAESDEYFASRPRQSQIGSWASKQSAEIASAFEFEKRIAKYGLKYAIGKVPRPVFWGGYVVVPERIEFWEAREFRLHDRRVFEKGVDGQWSVKKIYP